MKLVQFTPNKNQRYAANLRKIIAKRLINEKDTQKNLKLLKIISVFSALCREERKEKVKLLNALENLLTQVSLKYKRKEKDLDFVLGGNENYEIDYSILKLLVLEMLSSPTKDEIFFEGQFLKNRIIFTVQNANPTQVSECFIRKLKGVLIKTRGESNFSVMLSAPSFSYDKSLSEDNEDFKNSFSTINVMLLLYFPQHI